MGVDRFRSDVSTVLTVTESENGVRLPGSVLTALSLSVGEYVAIDGGDRTVAQIDGRGQEGEAALPGGVCRDADVEAGDRITVTTADVRPARSIAVVPVQSLDFRGGEGPIRAALAGRAVTVGDTVRVPLFDGALVLAFRVVDTDPGGSVVVGDDTAVEVTDEPADGDPSRGGVPDIDFAAVGGMDDHCERLRELVGGPLDRPELFDSLGSGEAPGVLVSGPAGAGKTLLARATAGEIDARLLSISPSTVLDATGEGRRRVLDRLATEAETAGRALVLLDELSIFAPADPGTAERRTVAALVDLLDDLVGRGVPIVATARDPSEVHDSLRRGGRLDREIELPVPDETGRREILDIRTRNVRLAPSADLDDVAARTHGFVGADVDTLVSEAALAAYRRTREGGGGAQLTGDDFEAAMTEVEPSAMRGQSVRVPEVSYEDVGGLDAAKRELVRVAEWPLRYPQLFDALGTEPPTGVLLYGPPGTGKTLLARAVANASDANFIAINGPELLNKYVGESERAVREVFGRARQNAPAIVFFDEIDAISPERSGDADADAAERVVSQLLTEFDGIEPLENVLVVAATNRPDTIDSALLRPGRLEKAIEVPLPDDGAREVILRIHTRTMGTEDVDLGELAAATTGYSGSDIEALVREAALLAIEEYLRASADGDQPETLVVTGDHFDRALEKVQPSVSDEAMERYEAMADEISRR
ncbi:AAA family ATPase [Halobacteriales archaeon SW_7_68_16]|nr:MAG: AAA family ATPase [Halobacteriales archaeon SW_7_68_16]